MASDISAMKSHLEQEHVLSAIAAMNGELARPLFGGDDMQLRRKCGNGDHRLACNVCAGHCQLQTLSRALIRNCQSLQF